MPTFNLTPILFPKPKKDDVYDMLKDLLQIKEKQFAIDEGGEINNPSSYDPLIKEYEAIVNDPSIRANDRRDAQKQLNNLMIKKLKTDLDKKKQIDAGDLKQMVNQDLRELEFEFPGNPIAYATGAMMKYKDVLYGTAEREGLNQLIDIFEHNAIDTTSLREYQLVCQEELSKFSDIMDAYETGDMNRLSEYAVVYTPYAGKVKAMQIIFRGDTDPNHSQPTDLRYSRDVAGNLVVAPDTGKPDGMQIYFVRANAAMGDKYNFGNSSFVYGVTGWETKDAAAFDYGKIKHAPLHSLPSGSFVRDSKDKLYYVNRDRSFYPVRDIYKEELNFSEDKVYNLSPDEEINILPGAIDHTTFPVFERYSREEIQGDVNFWQSMKEGWTPATKKVFGALEETFVQPAVKSFAESFKRLGKSFGLQPEKPSWEPKEVKPIKLIEESKSFITKSYPKF